MTKSDYRYFDIAKYISFLSNYKRVHIGCIAIYRGNIISSGYNTNKTHPIQKEYNRYRKLDGMLDHKLHAETLCILGMQYYDLKFSKVRLYIYREDLYGNIVIAKPCEACMKLIKDYGIRNIYYTISNGYHHEKIR